MKSIKGRRPSNSESEPENGKSRGPPSGKRCPDRERPHVADSASSRSWGLGELPRRCQLWDQSYSEHTHRFDDRIEAWIPVFRQCFVEPGAGHAGILG